MFWYFELQKSETKNHSLQVPDIVTESDRNWCQKQNTDKPLQTSSLDKT